MTKKTVYVTKAQASAAQALVARSAKTGRIVSSGVAKIAAAPRARQTAAKSASSSSRKTATG